MNRRTFLALTPLASAAWGQSGGAEISAADLKDDLRILHAAFEEGHPGFYRYTPKADMDAVYARAESALAKPMDWLGFYRVVAPAVAAVKCGHTQPRPPASAADFFNKELRVLPLEVKIIGGKLWAFRDHGFAGKYAGREIESINGVTVSKLLPPILAVSNGDGNSGPVRESRASRRFGTLLWAIGGIQPPYRVKFAGEKTAVESAGMLASEFPTSPQPAVAEFRVLDGKIGYLKIRGFGGPPIDGKPLDAYYADRFEEMNKSGVASLILDLRDNGGGRDEWGQKLFAHLHDKPFRYYRALTLNKLQFDFAKYAGGLSPMPEDRVTKRADGKYDATSHPNWGMKQPIEPHFAGKTIVLINGGSFSATCEFATMAKFHKAARFVGEETGGAFTGNTSGATAGLELPHSKLRVGVPLMGYYMAAETDRPDRGIFPDVTVAPTIEDLINGRDPVMDRATAMLKG
ncbi:MAG: S41 family peptidase [Bryobacteraceae bacterium]